MEEKKSKAPRSKDHSETARGAAPFTLTNYILFAVGLLDIVVGWFLLRGGHITIAPIMLIAGYCVIIPMAIMLRRKQPENAQLQ